MARLKALTDFTYFHQGYNRADYVAEQEFDVDDAEMVGVAVAEGWAKRIKPGTGNKDSAGQIVENRDAAHAVSENKSAP